MRSTVIVWALCVSCLAFACSSQPAGDSTHSAEASNADDTPKTDGKKAPQKTEYKLGDRISYGGFTWKFVSVTEQVDGIDGHVHYALRFGATNQGDAPRMPCHLSAVIVDSTGHQADRSIVKLDDRQSWDGESIYPGVTVHINRWTRGLDPLDGYLRVYLNWKDAGLGIQPKNDERCAPHSAILKIPASEWARDMSGRAQLNQIKPR